jgi:pimeloyl-ACP methyl ester carboxylesterase
MNTVMTAAEASLLVDAAARFSVPFGKVALVGDRLTPASCEGTALLLHGAGTSTGQGFAELRAFLYARQIETIAFDFVGHGRTGGAQLGTTVAQRVEQALAIVRSQGLAAPQLTVIGFSMGAYVAVLVASALGAQRMCLAIPAAYAQEAYTVPFGPQFTEVLRRPRGWESSDAFGLMQAYTGHLLVLAAEHDQAIPAEIPGLYLAAAWQTRSRKQHTVARSGHDLSAHYDAEPEARWRAYEEIAALCQRSLR